MEEIDKEAFLLLNENLLAALLPRIGVRAKFLAKLTELKQEVILTDTSNRYLNKQQLQSVMLSCFFAIKCSKDGML